MKHILVATALILFCGPVTAGAQVSERDSHSLPTLGLWVDTDPACSLKRHAADVDDCFVLEAIRKLSIKPVGISSTGGNASANITWEVLTRWRDVAPIYRGGTNSCSSPAVVALGKILRKQSLRILALGPLTNIATTLRCYPEVGKNIEELVFVGGRFKGEVFYLGTSSRTLRDLNFESDISAYHAVRKYRIPIQLTHIPFREGNRLGVRIRASAVANHLGRIPKESFYRWSRVWAMHGSKGVAPFDFVALAYVLKPNLFRCEPVEVEVHGRALRLTTIDGGDSHSHYCQIKDPKAVKHWIIKVLQRS